MPFLCLQSDKRNRSILYLSGKLFRDNRSRLGQHFPGLRADHILRQGKSRNAVAESKLFIKFIASHLGEIVPSHIKKHAIDKILRAVHCERLPWSQFLIELQKAILVIVRGILGKACQNLRLLTKHVQNLLIRPDTKGTDQYGDGNLSVSIYTNVKYIIGVSLIL